MAFSKRLGLVPEKEIQINSMDSALKNKLYNYFREQLMSFKTSISISSFVLNELGELIQNDINDRVRLLNRFRSNESANHWFETYDIIEYFLQAVESVSNRDFGYNYIINNTYGVITKDKFFTLFSMAVNSILEEEKSGYRLLNNEFRPITSDEEIASLTQSTANPFEAVRTHMQKALALYSDRQHPDYENSIKESISAVEALCSIITGETGSQATLGKMIKKLTDNGITIHKSMEIGFDKLYGYTSDAGGIRHGSIDFTNAPSEDALYMLISYSAFVNYLTAKYEQIQK